MSIDTTGAMSVDLSGYQPAGNYLTSVPIGGASIGGVKNGGNVTIEADGTMNAGASGGAIKSETITGSVGEVTITNLITSHPNWLYLTMVGKDSHDNLFNFVFFPTKDETNPYIVVGNQSLGEKCTVYLSCSKNFTGNSFGIANGGITMSAYAGFLNITGTCTIYYYE